MKILDKTCRQCGQPLMESRGNTKYNLHLCDNVGCKLYRQQQGIVEKAPTPQIKVKPGLSKILRKGYQRWLEKKKEYYRIARELGLPPKEAMYYTSKSAIEKLQEERLCVQNAGTQG